MVPTNKVKLSFDAISINEGFARMAVSGFVMNLNPTIEEIADIKTAISEAVTNCIVHGYRGTSGEIYITITSFENRSIKIKVRDKGCGIENIEKAMEAMFTTDPQSERSGLGFSMMEHSMDYIKVNSTLNKGTTVTMHKKLSSR